MPAPGKGIALESLTWPEAEALFRRTPAPVIVLPVGARTKEHGLHLPLNNDWILAEYLLMRVLDALPVVALPGIPYGYYPAFLEYPGSSATSSTSCSDSLAPTSPRRRRCHGIWPDRVGRTRSPGTRAATPGVS